MVVFHPKRIAVEDEEKRYREDRYTDLKGVTGGDTMETLVSIS